MSSSHTGRAARSMQAAFGCYCDDKLHPMPDPYRRADWAMYIVSAAGLVTVILCLIFN